MNLTYKEKSALCAGVAKNEITIAEKGVAVKDPLYAKALVLDDGKTKAVIVALDALAIGGIGDISDDFLPQLRRRIESELDIEGDRVLVSATHTHPPGRILCDEDVLLERTFDAVRRANTSLVPVTVGVGKGREDRISINRILRLKNGKHWTTRHGYPSPPDQEIESLGPLDPEIGVLRIDRLDGRPLAVVYNFACHLLFGDLQNRVTANLVGVASRFLEESFGEDAMAIFLQGAAGDVNDSVYKDFYRLRDVETLGLRLGRSTLLAARAIETGDATLNTISETIELPRRTDSLERIAALRREQQALLKSLRGLTLDFKTFVPLYLKQALATPGFEQKPGEAAAMEAFVQEKLEKYLNSVTAMERLAKIEDDIATFERHLAINTEANSPTAPAQVLGIKIGECVFVSAPIEILTEVSLNIKRASPYEHTFIAAFANGYLHYGAPAEYYDKGSYEVTECLLAPQWQQIYETKVDEIIRRL
jgi:hypothetical protein